MLITNEPLIIISLPFIGRQVISIIPLRCMGLKREILTNSFLYSKSNYCSLVWHFCSSKSQIKIEKIQKHALRIIHNVYSGAYSLLLHRSEKGTMSLKRLRLLALEVFKTLNHLTSIYMNDLSQETKFLTQRPSIFRSILAALPNTEQKG